MKYLFTFKNINKYLDNIHSKMIYHTFIQSTLSYGIEIWGKCYNTHLIDLKRLIKKLQKNLGLTHDKTILPFDQLYLYRLITTFHEYTKIHPINTDTSRYNLRNNSIPRITPRLETVKRQILYTEPTIYSKLPNDIKQIENSRTFKKNLYQFLLKNKHFASWFNKLIFFLLNWIMYIYLFYIYLKLFIFVYWSIYILNL